MRIGKTNVHDETLKNNMQNALKNMGSAFWAMINEGDEIQLLETFNTAAYDIYDKFAERANSEMSKLILSQTGTTEEKAHVGSAGVHQDVLKQLVEQDVKFHDSTLNEVIKPILIQHGFPLSDGYFATTYEDNMSMKEKADLVVKMMPFVNFNVEYLKEEFDIEIDGLKDSKKPLTNELRKYYDTL